MIHHLAKIFAHVIFRMWMPPRRINVGRFVHHHVNTFFRYNLINPLIIRLHTHRMLLMPPVTRHINKTVWRPNHNRSISRNRMQGMNKLHRKMLRHLNIFVLKRVYYLIIHFRHVFEFRHLLLNHTNRKIGRVNRREVRKFRQQMPTRTNMV